MLTTRSTNHLGQPVNEAHHLHLFTDAQVAHARKLRAAGASARAIAAVIGCHHTTALRWVTQRMRKPAVSVRVVRAKLNTPPSGKGVEAKLGEASDGSIEKTTPAPTPTPEEHPHSDIA